MSEDLVDLNWINYSDGEIEIKSKFYIEAAIDYVNFLLADDETEDLIEAKEVVERQIEFLRRATKPAKSALVIDQVGILATGKSQFKLGVLETKNDQVPTKFITNQSELFKHNLDPLLIGLGFMMLHETSSSNAKLHFVRKIKLLIQKDNFISDYFKLSNSIQHINVTAVKKVFPTISKKNNSESNCFELSTVVTTEDGSEKQIKIEDVNVSQGFLRDDQNNYMPLSESTLDYLNKAQSHQYITENDVPAYLADQYSVIGSGFDPDEIDITKYSDRIEGFEFLKKSNIIEAGSGIKWYQSDNDDRIFFRAKNIEGKSVDVVITDTSKLQTALLEMQQKSTSQAEGTPDPTVKIEDYSIPVNEENIVGLKEVVSIVRNKTEKKETSGKGKIQVAKIKESAESRFNVQPIKIEQVTDAELDSVVKTNNITLKEHQKEGVSWLLSHFNAQNGGVILADDMGLGKTVQLLTFIALAKNKFSEKVGSDAQAPILVVAPKILLDNWQNEVEKYIQNGILDNSIILTSDRIKTFKDRSGKLNLKPLLTYDLIVTNYNTFASYQVDLLLIPFSIAVLDESQNIKNPETAQTRAARGLKNTFSVCCTGTPVENGFLDLWSQVDVTNRQPGNPLGDKADFSANPRDSKVPTEQIRKILAVGEAGGLILRRQKNILTGFPKKIVHPAITVKMNELQANKEKLIVSLNKKNRLKVIQQLQALYQHPTLLGADDEIDPNISVSELIAQSPKLEVTLRLLNQIQQTGEKVLIFTLWTRMQMIIKKCIDERFNLNVKIINGQTNAGPQGTTAAKKIITEFEKISGFNVLVLSPLAAGAGITITGANHVVHYGRWWNPAKEDQATDRAYRIGQKRDVNVYYPTLVNADNSSFDLKLHNYVESKRMMARDFLDPIANLDIGDGELNQVFGE